MITTVAGVKKIITDTWSADDLAGPAIVYLSALDEAERLYGAEGIKSLIPLITKNLRARNREQREVKKELLYLARR